jgi:hypothetical protein
MKKCDDFHGKLGYVYEYQILFLSASVQELWQYRRKVYLSLVLIFVLIICYECSNRPRWCMDYISLTCTLKPSYGLIPRRRNPMKCLRIYSVGMNSEMEKFRGCKVKVKVKLSLCLTKHHSMKMYWASGGIAPHILYLRTRWRWVVSFTPRPLYPQGKSSWYPLNRRLRGPQSRSGRGSEEKNSQPLPGIEL